MLIAHFRMTFIATLALAGTLACLPAQALVISQVYGGGGNGGAFYTNDFIEIFNDSAAALSLSGLSVQYAAAAGTAWQKTNLSGLLGPYRYYLVQEAAGSAGSAPLPAPDAAGAINLSAVSGKVALVNGTALLTGIACPSVSLLDFVGYGAANCYEGPAAVPMLASTLAALRLQGGLTDSNDNLGDFTLLAPNPRNSGSLQNIPVAATPGPGAAALPEPPSWLLLLAGLGAASWLRRSRSAGKG